MLHWSKEITLFFPNFVRTRQRAAKEQKKTKREFSATLFPQFQNRRERCRSFRSLKSLPLSLRFASRGACGRTSHSKTSGQIQLTRPRHRPIHTNTPTPRLASATPFWCLGWAARQLKRLRARRDVSRCEARCEAHGAAAPAASPYF